MKKLWLLGLAFILVFSSCFNKQIIFNTADQYFPTDAIRQVEDASCAIAVYYFMGEEEYLKRVSGTRTSGVWRECIFPKIERNLYYSFKTIFSLKPTLLQTIMPLDKFDFNGQPIYVIAYIGAGHLTRFDHIVSVRHLFVHDDNTYNKKIWVFLKNMDHAIEADLTAISLGNEFSDDYAVIRLKETTGRRGLKIARPDSLKKGMKAIASGSVGGTAYFHRFVTVSTFKYFLQRKSDGGLHLSFWENFEYLMNFPGGPGDSGGALIIIEDGEPKIATITYCGIEIYAEQYVFSNPTSMLWEFLREYRLEWIGK